MPQTGSLQTTEIYYLTVLQTGSPESIEASARMYFLIALKNTSSSLLLSFWYLLPSYVGCVLVSTEVSVIEFKFPFWVQISVILKAHQITPIYT